VPGVGLFELLLLWIEKRCTEFFMQMVIEFVCHATHYSHHFNKSFFGQPSNGTNSANIDCIVVNSDCDLTPNIEIQFEKAAVER